MKAPSQFILRFREKDSLVSEGWEATCEGCGEEISDVTCIIGRIIQDSPATFLKTLEEHKKRCDRKAPYRDDS